jgi:hypothetical protein
MKKFYYLLLLCMFSLSANAKDEAPATSFGVSLGQDPIFGFYPSFNGSIAITDNMQFTAYGIFWTADALGGNLGGLNLLTEFGGGLNFTLMDGALNINPQLGFAHGNYQSGGGAPVIADNIVPSLGIYFNKGDFSASLNGIIWKGLRKAGSNTPYYDLMEYTFQPSYALSRFFSIGLYYDHLLCKADYAKYNKMHVDQHKSETTTAYLWVGPSVKVSFGKGINVMFTAGADLTEYMNDQPAGYEEKVKEYYKMVLNIPF